MNDYDEFYDDTDLELGDDPAAQGLGLLHAESTRLERERAPKKKYGRGPNAPAPSTAATIRSNIKSAQADLQAAQEFYDQTDSLQERAALNTAMDELRGEIAGLEQEQRVLALKDTDPTATIQLDYERARDIAAEYKRTHASYNEDATYRKLTNERDDLLNRLVVTQGDVELRNARADAAVAIDNASRAAADKALNATVERLQAEMQDLGTKGRFAEAAEVEKRINKIRTTVPDKLPEWQRAYAETRTTYLLAQAAPTLPERRPR